MLSEPGQATPEGLDHPNSLERFLATQLRTSQDDGTVDPALSADVVAAGLLALTNGLGASVLGGQRDGPTALAILNYHLDRLFTRGQR